MLAASRASANLVRTDASTVEPEITTNSDAQDRSNRHNVFCLIEIGIKEGITEGITNIFGKEITNPILQTMDDIDFKSVDQFQFHQLFTSITEGAEIPEATNIRRQFVNIAGTILYFRETVITNVDRMKALATKWQGCGVRVHIDLHAGVIRANI